MTCFRGHRIQLSANKNEIENVCFSVLKIPDPDIIRMSGSLFSEEENHAPINLEKKKTVPRLRGWSSIRSELSQLNNMPSKIIFPFKAKSQRKG